PPGRRQPLEDDPFALLDGAVPRSSARSVIESLAGRLQKPVAAVVSIPADKDWQGVLDELAPVCDHLVLTRLNNLRLRFTGEAAAYARQVFPTGVTVQETANFKEARA